MIKQSIIKQVLKKNATSVVTVSTMPVRYQWWQPTLLSYGSLRAAKGVNVTTELAGLIRTIYFKPGAEVRAGEPLLELNADADNALLKALEAQAKAAEIVYQRDSAQFRIKAISKAKLDADQQALKNLQAQVAQQAAMVAKKKVIAPFTGRLGICAVNPGQYLNAGDQVVTLQALDPLYADFYVPQQNLVQLQLGSAVRIKIDTYPDKIFKGTITTINPLVDAKTRNIEIEATIPNADFALYPGMFVSVEVITGERKRYLTVPQTAISFNPYGDIAYIVKEKRTEQSSKPLLTALQTFVKTGEKRGDQIAVLQGLSENDRVVTSGQLKLKNGSLVAINNTVLPSNNPLPLVSDG